MRWECAGPLGGLWLGKAVLETPLRALDALHSAPGAVGELRHSSNPTCSCRSGDDFACANTAGSFV